jgi:hypothetical protein
MGSGTVDSLLDINDSYHGFTGNPYFHPCGDNEASRLDAVQHIFRSVYGRNVMVRIARKPTLIIDVGTGSG